MSIRQYCHTILPSPTVPHPAAGGEWQGLYKTGGVMSWYHYIAYFFAGALIANSVPHYVMGATGRKFPTPFSVPPGTGESTAMINIVWALGNFFVGYLLLQVGNFSVSAGWPVLTSFVGAAAMSIMLAKHFGSVYSPLQ